MRFVRTFVVACIPALIAAVAVAQTAAPPPPLPLPKVLGGVQPGSWHLRMIDGSSGTPADICISDPRLLVHLRHGTARCDRFVGADEERMASISYTCPGVGSGRTTLRLEPAGALRIDSQGIADSAPYAFVADAQRTGDCAAATAPPAAAPPPAR